MKVALFFIDYTLVLSTGLAVWLGAILTALGYSVF